jgi:plastocyanin
VRTRPVLVAVLAGAALVCAAPAQAGKPKPKTVRIYDNYFLKDRLKVKVGTTVIWRWPGFDESGDVHDVKLKSGPRGVKKFHSEAAATDFSFRRKLKVRGKYKIVCTLHEEMAMRIRVRR